MQTGESETILSADFVMTYGRDIVVVKEEAPGHFLDDPEKLLTKEVEEELEQPGEEGMEALRAKQVELLKAKKAVKDIYAGNGEQVIAAGTVLSEEDIKRAQEAGPGVFVELSMHVDE
ncbi:hypothetical protein B4099_2734 [Heyndrickxia coagulans]|uniref:Uncharacterized protein n=1 Tax=Heyndrickxia coagulans TaxID=1398 RepID=A0A150KIZ2_HEYCO|nr:hypothetical protein [Heyndrickxia coagulans]KYC73774.1 hypothetical protein B4099_2734 [Heyndrickxia coagulans]